MAQYDNTNGGAIFKNDRKGTNEKAPDYKGAANYNGVDFEIALWVREGKNGKFFSVKTSAPYKKDSAPTATTPQETDDLPF